MSEKKIGRPKKNKGRGRPSKANQKNLSFKQYRFDGFLKKEELINDYKDEIDLNSEDEFFEKETIRYNS